MNVGMAIKGTTDGHILHILLRQIVVSANNTQEDMVAKDLQAVPRTTLLNCLEITRRGKMSLRLNANKRRNKEKI